MFVVSKWRVGKDSIAPSADDRRMCIRREKMADFRPITRDELDELAGEALPERAAMSLINANVAVPVNAAVAANVLTDHSTSTATSAPNGPITQQPNLRS